MIKTQFTVENIVIFRFVEEHENLVSIILEEGVFCEKSPLFQVRGQIWEEVVRPRILEELDKYWRKLAKKGRTLEEAARYNRNKKRPSTDSIITPNGSPQSKILLS